MYDSNIIKAQIKTHYKYFFAPEKTHEPRLSTTLQHLSHFEDNKRFFTEHLLPLTKKKSINLANLFEMTAQFSREQRRKHIAKGGGLLD
jgi:hypothetical protein